MANVFGLARSTVGLRYLIRNREGLGRSNRVADFPFTERRSTRRLQDAVVELVVDHSVPDIANHVLAVHAVRGTEVLSELWRSSRAGPTDHP